MFRSRGFLICSDNLLMFVLRLLNPWCSQCWLPNQTAWLGQKRCWHVQCPGWFGSYSQPPFLSQKEKISVWYPLLSRGCLQKSQTETFTVLQVYFDREYQRKFMLVHTEKLSWNTTNDLFIIFRCSWAFCLLSSTLLTVCVLGYAFYYYCRNYVVQLFKKEWPLSYLHPWYFLDSHLVSSTWLCLM